MKHPRIKVYCKNCREWTDTNIVSIVRSIYGDHGECRSYKVFGCAYCLTPHLSPTGKFIDDYTILCRNYNVEWPTKVIKDVQKT
jgi:hypothetical protein